MKRILLFLLRIYKGAVSPYWPGVCRFQPTCSEYARDSIVIHGTLRGSFLAIRRVARCGPWQKGGYDPVPETEGDRDVPGRVAIKGG